MPMKHVVIDGSNIATEGRDTPSLAQLDEAVRAFIEEYHPAVVTVVVDATFPNRIGPKERRIYEDAVAANELITPPAGAIGRGDAFVLQIARRANASILSNDSFQEFHGDHPWLFERGRLIGGKPVPHVGWVFMERAPVRGVTSRRSVSESRKATKAASAKVAKAPKVDKAALATTGGGVAAAIGVAELAQAPAVEGSRDDGRREAVPARAGGEVAAYNEALPFIEFIADHPVGSEVEATVERFSSHGAYVVAEGARAYVPLRNLAHPAPRSAKALLQPGETRRFVVTAIDPPRRGIDLALPGVVDVVTPASPAGEGQQPASEAAVQAPAPATERAAGKRAPAAKRAARKAAAGGGPAGEAAAKKAARKAPTGKAPTQAAADKVAARAPARERAAMKTAAQASAATPPAKRAAKKVAAGRATGATPAAKRAAEAPAGKAPPRAPADKGAARARPAARAAKKAVAVLATAATPAARRPGKAPAEKAPAKQSGGKKPAAEPAPAKASRAGKVAGATPGRQSTARKPAARKPAAEPAPAKASRAGKAAGRALAARSPARRAAAAGRAGARVMPAASGGSATAAAPPATIGVTVGSASAETA